MAGRMQGAYPPPPPAQRSGNNGLLLWSLVGCGVIALLVVVIAGFTLKGVIKGSGAKGMFSVMGAVNPAAESVQKVETGIEAYQKDHSGQYPPKLDALVPKYVADKSAFVCGESDSPMPMEYAPPKPDAAEGVVVIRVHIGDIPISIGRSSQVQKMYVLLLKNGQVVSEQNVRTVLPRYGKGSSEGTRTY
jgi:hypothetical protein